VSSPNAVSAAIDSLAAREAAAAATR